MDKLMAPCGLACVECPAYVATQTGDPVDITLVAQSWSKAWRTRVPPEDIWCDGCTSSSKRKYKHAWKCKVRSCGVDRGVMTCAHCPDYICETLEAFFARVPRTRKLLQEIHERLKDC